MAGKHAGSLRSQFLRASQQAVLDYSGLAGISQFPLVCTVHISRS
jgi:hypothetical protein